MLAVVVGLFFENFFASRDIEPVEGGPMRSDDAEVVAARFGGRAM
jgi:hypothetical protein